MQLCPPPRLALRVACSAQLSQLALELRHAPQQPPTVDLELRLARSARSDAARLLAEALAPPAQSGQAVAQLGQLDLSLALLGARVLGEDVEDHGGAVDSRAPEDLLEVAALRGRQLVVEHNRVGVDLE